MQETNGIDSKFRLVLLAAKRAKQLIRGSRKRIDLKAENHLTIALEELQQGKVNFAVIEQEELVPQEKDQPEENGNLEADEPTPLNQEETELLDSITE